MVNANNEITIGSEKKRFLNAMISSFILDAKNNKKWAPEDIQILQGKISYCASIEKDFIENMINKYNKKYSVDFKQLIKDALYS